ncbi:zinc finger BED domain-containing protein 4-like [Hydra vulgaris]|uniref:Zinc finger BED domain-containing protein 4-like n=1 Tax=Hydra vulgaris TaxID=6087 RepID=A0ABM4CMJ4_HYDVU
MVQYTIPEQVVRMKIWDINNSSSIRIHRAIAKIIITDMEPIQVVQKTGFVELMRVLERRYTVPSRKYFSEQLIPEINDEVCAQLLVILDPVTSPFLSFTTDTWTSGNTVQSFMGLTAHWLTEHFENMSFVLDCKPFIGHHTAPALMTAFQQMLDKWNIDVGRCNVVLHDNAANISKYFRDAIIDSLGCFAHTIQTCVHDGLLNQRAVSDIISIAKKLRRALTVYCSEVDETYCPTAYQWSVAENLVCVVAPFEEATREVSYKTAHISLVIPVVTALRNLLKNEGNNAGVKTMKSTLLKSLDEHYSSTSSSLLWRCIDEIVQSTSAPEQQLPTSIDTQLSQYLAEPEINRLADPLQWWSKNMHRLPALATVARIYLGAPPTSVPSERLFSVAGEVLNDHRSSLLPHNAARLIFLKYNSKLIKD